MIYYNKYIKIRYSNRLYNQTCLAQVVGFLDRLHGEAGPDSTTGMRIIVHPEAVSWKRLEM